MPLGRLRSRPHARAGSWSPKLRRRWMRFDVPQVASCFGLNQRHADFLSLELLSLRIPRFFKEAASRLLATDYDDIYLTSCGPSTTCGIPVFACFLAVCRAIVLF